MSSYERSLAIVDALEAAGIRATADPRSATPPVVLVTPPDRTYDIACGYSARWSLFALVPGLGNADAHKAMDAMVDDIAAVIPLETAEPASYILSPDAPALPAYRCQFTEAL